MMQSDLNRAQILFLVATAGTTLLPHLPQLPLWAQWACPLLWLAASWRLLKTRRPPPRIILIALTLGAVAGATLTFRHLLGREPGTVILAAMLTLKLLESQTRRDAQVVIFLSLFLQLALFFTTQTVLIAGAGLFACILSLTTLQALVSPAAGLQHWLRTTLMMLAQGLPLMIALFMFFPRLPGPLWGLPSDGRGAHTGLSDSMSPGIFNELIISDEIALRAQFSGPPPPPAERYWRGPVLSSFDGLTWRAVPTPHKAEPFYTPSGRAYHYTSTIEATGNAWLLALDFPGPVDKALFGGDYMLLSREVLNQRGRFDMTAYTEMRPGLNEDESVLSRDRRLPAKGNPRARALGIRLEQEYNTPEARADALIRYFRDARLEYTLNPGIVEGDTIDGFLFETKRGFCEHFSASFVFVARAAGLAARVVTGYQGGRYDAASGIITVRQSDAHAWAEVWLPEKGWVRFDPTATAAPQRILEGLQEALPTADLPFMMRPQMEWLRSLRGQWEALNNRWNQWVIGYNTRRQSDVLEELGFSDTSWKTLGRLIALSSVIFIGALLLWVVLTQPARAPEVRAWAAFCRKLARAGLPRHPWEGPKAYAARAGAAFPEAAGQIEQICMKYAALRYGATVPTDSLNALRRGIRTLKLK